MMNSQDRSFIQKAIVDGRFDEAENLCRRFLGTADAPEALYLFALSRMERGDLDRALELFAGLVGLLPQRADLAFNFGQALMQAGRLVEAAAQWRRVVTIAPGFIDGWRNLALALSELERREEATEAFERLLALCPGERPSILTDIGNLCCRQGDLEKAEGLFHQVLAMDPHHAAAWTNLGELDRALGKDTEAEACFRRAVKEDPAFAKGHFNLGCFLLGQQRWSEGFLHYEWRATKLKIPRRLAGVPSWRGDEPPGISVALWNDQGYGDGIQFVRFASVLAERGYKVSLVLSPPLRRLLANVAGIDAVYPIEGPLPAFDAQISMASLPAALKVAAIEDVSAPYLTTAGTEPPVIPRTERLAVGFAWTGGGKDPSRFMPLAAFEPLLSLSGIDWISLQTGKPAADLEGLPTRGRVFDAAALLDDFAATASVVRQLDLVITVDTALAHVAGALGTPVWVLLRRTCDWRWSPPGQTSPWYPCARPIRQEREGCWTFLMTHVAALLEERRGAVF